MLFLFILVCVYSGFGWLFSRVGYNRAFPLIGGNQESGMVRGRPRSGSGLTGIWAIDYARTCPEWVVGENSGCGIRDNEFAWCFCWGMPTVSEFTPRLARPLPKTQPTSAWWGVRAGEVIYPGYPGCACPAVVNSARTDLQTVGGIGRTHDTSPRRGRAFASIVSLATSSGRRR